MFNSGYFMYCKIFNGFLYKNLHCVRSFIKSTKLLPRLSEKPPLIDACYHEIMYESWRQDLKPRDYILKTTQQTILSDEIISMRDSYQEILIPLSSNLQARTEYSNHLGYLRNGKLLEDMDLLAGMISIKHSSFPQKNLKNTLFYVATACVDNIEIDSMNMSTNNDILIRGHVTWTGKSSMEVKLIVEENVNNIWKHRAIAYFVMIARHGSKGKALINGLKVNSNLEKELYKLGSENMIYRKKLDSESLFNIPPNEKEIDKLHKTFINTLSNPTISLSNLKKLNNNQVWIHDTNIKNVVVCYPQMHNMHNKVFGGFLIKTAVELASHCSRIFSSDYPRLLTINDIQFKRPVDIGSILYLKAQIVYVVDNLIHVNVNAFIKPSSLSNVDYKLKDLAVTNIFNFIFATTEPSTKTVLPISYSEYMMQLACERRHNLYFNIN
ncbi:Acyl-CoA thioesterase 9 [Intoshia linei]|uniref:Acyl-CoA thioesterase 9 n=1 Tax=Intoshia linei TaxID=1819745 RepID=A0A177B9N9_9BILA|nr:Acyl-CoA thioesterase 9 [Intoshia linei]